MRLSFRPIKSARIRQRPVSPERSPRTPRGLSIHRGRSVPDWHSTGLCAAPGEVIEVELPVESAGQGLAVRIGCHTDTIWHLNQWKRFPEISRAWPLDETNTRVASPFGGLVYIDLSPVQRSR